MKRSFPFYRWIAAVLFLVIIHARVAAQDITDSSVKTVYLIRVPAGAAVAAGAQLSGDQRETLLRRSLESREQWATRVDNNPPSPPGLPLIRGLEAQIRESKAQIRQSEAPVQDSPADIVIERNNLNPNANNNLAEPVAVNSGRVVFFAGNTHAEFSIDGGVTWTDNSPASDGPPKAPLPCCDNDIVMDSARRVAFWSVLYRHPTNPTGIVRIHVRHLLSGDPINDCQYDFDPGQGIFDTDTDFPHLGLTKNFLWLTTAEVGLPHPFQRAMMYRFPIDTVASCSDNTLAGEGFIWPELIVGPRVWIPVEGANLGTTMYWGHLDNSTTFRIFSWPEAAAAPTSVTRRISRSTFGDPDCHGGVGNFNFIEGFVATSITGYSLHGAVGRGQIVFFWNVKDDALHPQGHIHAALFRETNLTLLAQPHIWNSNFCFGFPAVTANKAGDFGMSLAFGGQKGGGGRAAQGAVGISDDFSPGPGLFDNFLIVAEGTHNRTDGRYGDYLSIRPHEPSELWFVATSYALFGGTAANNVNLRYVEFGRLRSFRSYFSHFDQFPNP
jgi:hypothetical protein